MNGCMRCGLCLHKEFQIRYGKDHMSVVKLKSILKNAPTNIPDAPFTQPIQAMPDDVKNDDSITAYQRLLYKVQEKFCNMENYNTDMVHRRNK